MDRRAARPLALLMVALAFALPLRVWAGTQALVIAQFYGAGGNTGSTYMNDYVVLHNRTAFTVNLAGYTLQYNSGGGTGFWLVTSLPNVFVPPGGFFLIQEAAGVGGTTPLPPPDAIGTINFSATNGRLALVSNTVALVGSVDPTVSPIVDFVGYGASAVNFEGSGPAPAPPTAAQEGVRLDSGSRDSDDNISDFTTAGANPRNSSSSPVIYNFPPTARPDEVSTFRNTPVAIPAASLTLNDFDPEGDTLTVSDVGALSSRGGVVSLSGGSVTYTPPVSYIGLDVIFYRISDGSSFATGEVNVTVTDLHAPTPSLVSVAREAGGTRVIWHELSSRAFSVEFNDTLTNAWQSFAGTITANAQGTLEYFDTTSPAPNQRYYRTVLGP
jgi:Bacterial Ig domain/Lamin Tail Domain